MIINTKKLNCIGFIGYLFAIFFLFLSLIALGGMLPFIIGGLVMIVFSFLVRIEAALIKKQKSFGGLFIIIAGIGYLICSLGLIGSIIVVTYLAGYKVSLLSLVVEFPHFLFPSILLLILGILLLITGLKIRRTKL